MSVDIVRVIGERVTLQPRGWNTYVGRCPFHAEETPSFHVDRRRGSFHCFGCGAGGDAARFLERLDGIPVAEAERQLAARFGLAVQA